MYFHRLFPAIIYINDETLQLMNQELMKGIQFVDDRHRFQITLLALLLKIWLLRWPSQKKWSIR